ncbi:error-prone DNA polymerase [Marinobacterium arenosum]|uniref:error-prone DNA polymerase n=1 Tax=Marinobacterium arenosum TaxID=2862496 RepID=UPI001C954E26|nr:error-prone DNA polymerase [Marinobacterium arenosum]MBY4675912.1 error-prone DNA polymerase [Marinobacterium arenosum]
MSYAELHCLSNFSFLRGASHPEELVQRAAELGYRALALTDECSVAGVVRAWQACRELPPGHNLKLIVGAEFRLDDSCQVLLAPDRTAYGQLCSLISKARRRAGKGRYEIHWSDFESGLDGCLLLFRPPRDEVQAHRHGRRLAGCFPERCWLLVERLLEADDQQQFRQLQGLARRLNLPLVCANDVHMHLPQRQRLQDLLTAIRLRTTVQRAGQALACNGERHLRSLNKLRRLYPPELREQTLAIAERCRFDLSELRYEYPAELVPPGQQADAYLAELVASGCRSRFPDGVPANVQAQIDKELQLIRELGYAHFFLTIHDIVQFARSRDILCQGRGSAANSVVCYCLHITEVDPREVNLLFERFISRERNEPPDIDVDFEHERREEVIQYIYRTYGRDRAGLAATVISYRAKSAIRDVGKALGMDESYLAWLISRLDRRDHGNPWLKQLAALGGERPAPLYRQFVELVAEILDFPRHLSQHVGGFVISAGPLAELVPVENAAMAERTVIQWNKDDLEALGLLKVDLLALGMLTAIRKTLALLGETPDRPLRIQDIPREDKATYEMLSRGDSVGVFQVESRAQMNMLPRLKPQSYYDLVIEVAIVRPGPIQGDMVHPYLKRRDGIEDVEYPSEAVRAVLARTLGVPIFQEQVIELAMVAAGFSGGEADQLRRAMAAWKRSGQIRKYQQKLIDGMLERGYDRTFAERICRQIEGFGEYGFPESHAASFALLVYVSAWLKRHHPAAFFCGLLNSQPMGFYSPSQLVQDAQRHGVEVLPVSINESRWDHALESVAQGRAKPAATEGCCRAGAGRPNAARRCIDAPGDALQSACCGRHNPVSALRLGLRLVKGLSRSAADRLLSQRPATGFVSLAEARRLCRLSRGDWDALAAAGALNPLSRHRYQARWELLEQPPQLELAGPDGSVGSADAERVQLAAPGEQSDLEEDFRHLGLSLGRHPLALLREQGVLGRCLSAAQLRACRHGQLVHVAGLVTNRQRPGTASGATFVTLEDESGQINLVVWQATAKAQRSALLTSRILQVSGVLEREGEVIHVVAGRLRDISFRWDQLKVKSRDFR